MKKRFFGVIIVGTMALAALLSLGWYAASAATTDLTGTWNCCGNGGAAAQNFIITSGGGSLAGRAELPGGRVFAAITGSSDGSNVNIVTTYNEFAPGYVAPFVGKLSVDGNMLSGTWSSNRNQSGTWTATRGSGTAVAGPTTPLTPTPTPEPVLVAKIIQIKNVAYGKSTKLEYTRGDKWYTAFETMDLQVGDKLRTDDNTVAAIEFVIGGRVGINKSSVIEVVSDSSVKEGGKATLKRILIRQGGMWAKMAKRNDPLEIQTNGGIIGIKG